MRILPARRFSAVGNNGNRFLQLRAGRHQRSAISQRPAVILRVSDLHALRIQLLDERDHLFQMVEILAVHDQVYGERDLVLSRSSCGKFDFVGMRFCAGNPVGRVFA